MRHLFQMAPKKMAINDVTSTKYISSFIKLSGAVGIIVSFYYKYEKEQDPVLHLT